MRVIFYTMMVCILLVSCSSKENNRKNENSILVDIQIKDSLNNLTDQLLLSEVIQDLEIVPLETSEEYLLNKVQNITLGKQDIFVAMFENILRFERNTGKFLNIVTRFGEGPDEVLYCNGVGIDQSNKLIYTLAGPLGKNEIKAFTYDGVWKSTVRAAKIGAWMEAGSFDGANRAYNYFNGKHVFRRMLPIQDGSKDLWQIGIMDTVGKYMMKMTDPACMEHQRTLTDHMVGKAPVNLDIVKYAIFSASPIQNRYYNHINYLFDTNDTIYRYSEKQNTFKPRYILHCGDRPGFTSLHKMAKDNDYFQCLFVTDILETKEHLFLIASQNAYSYLLRINKKDGSITSIRNQGEFKETPAMKVKYVDVEAPAFTNDICGGLPFYPFDQNENTWIAQYDAAELLEKIDMEKLKATKVLQPEKKAQLIRILENLKEDDNPVIMIATLK